MSKDERARDRRMSASAKSGTPDLELHGAKTGNCLRAAIGLSEAGLPYKIRHVDLRRGEQRDEAHLALNPAGKVPVLLARGSANTQAFVLTQSSAILFYADAAAPGRILPRLDRARMRALEAFFYFTSDVIALNGVAFSLRSPEFSGAAATLTERYLAAIAGSEHFLIDNEFVGGASFSIADIAAFTIISAVSRHVPWNQLPRLAAWCERIGRRPAVQTGMAAFDDKRETVN
jgi:GSH-dependent disulfide-bond oxidoreductase